MGRQYDDRYNAMRDRKDLLAMQALAPLCTAYVPWSISAMRPSGIVAILNEITVNRRRTVVELGGGVSTLYIARLLQRRGGHVWTVEHDEGWADLLTEELANEALDRTVTVIRAPLAPVGGGWPGEDGAWYAQDCLGPALAGCRVDLLVVDGPPAYQAGRGHARYPAARFFAPLFADDYTVVLDDIDRPGEQEIMERWAAELGVTFECRLVDGGIAIGRRKAAFSI
ncbi:class I SAM-dependent methyltransferase [Rhizomonospora bruguierae]|uniref:class I SAM-dependent methyltransferase n=1 Tax=Rhizomonospora bruguierae TaxID=1581705 RepID=UPI001BCB311A|nr:class I SAM-dependent methyltransferase [Micromonospora sp. NBRC 107566]